MDNRHRNNPLRLPVQHTDHNIEINQYIHHLTEQFMSGHNNQEYMNATPNYNSEIQSIINVLGDMIAGYNNNIRLFTETMNNIQNNLYHLNRTSSRTSRQSQQPQQPQQQQQPFQYQYPSANERHPNRNTYNVPRFPESIGGINMNRQPVAPQYPFQHSNPLFNAIYTIFTRPVTEINQFENVIVRPSDEEMQTATRIIQYSTQTENISSNCPITLENFEEGQRIRQIIHCGHCFNEEAINNWFNAHVRCPVCRYDIRNYNVEPSAATSSTDASANPMQSHTQLPPLRTMNLDEFLNDILNSSFNDMLGNNLYPDNSFNVTYTFDYPMNHFNDPSYNAPELDMVD